MPTADLTPQVGFEPTTHRLTADCSSIELLRILFNNEKNYSKGIVRVKPRLSVLLNIKDRLRSMNMDGRKEPRLIVHGGAGTWIADSSRLAQAMVACRESAVAGQKVLLNKDSALEAVETAVRILEDDPALNAGRGSYPNLKGQIEMDALIMDGSTLNLGAVAAVQQIKNPITLARLVMTDNEHNILVGSGAEIFAESVGIERCQLEDLIFHWPEPLPPQTLKDGNALSIGMDLTSDTVGAVALDSFGNLAAATSTGGIRNKYPGRVGDSPLVGSGAYADNLTAAVSATGDGESLMKIVVSKQVCDLVANGLSAQEACEVTINILGDRVRGFGGLIAVDHLGGLGFAFNTKAMPHAIAVGQGAIESAYSSPIRF